MPRVISIAILSLLATACIAFAQPEIQWSQTYGGESSDVCNSLVRTSMGGFALAGHTGSYGAESSDFLLVLTNENGELRRAINYRSEDSDYACSLVATASGGFAMAGYTPVFNPDFEIWDDNIKIVTTNGIGGDPHVINFETGSLQHCYAMIQADNGSLALVGRTGGHEHHNPFSFVGDLYFMITSSRGELIRDDVYDYDEDDAGYAIVQTSDRGFAIAGYTGDPFNDFEHVYLVRAGENGGITWVKTYSIGYADVCKAIIETSDGGLALAGSAYSRETGNSDFFLLRTNEDGDSLWSRTYGGAEADHASSIIETDDGGFVLAGYTESFGNGETDMWLLRTDRYGDSLWSCTFGGNESDVATSLLQADDGSFILAGTTRSFGEGSNDFWLIKTTSDPVSVGKPPSSIAYAFTLHPAYPNPFNSSTTVGYSVPSPMRVTMTVHDLQGRKLFSCFDDFRTAGEYRQSVSMEGMVSGVYVVRLGCADDDIIIMVVYTR